MTNHTPGPWTTRHWWSTSSFGVAGPSGRILCADMDGKPQPGTGSEGGEADYLEAKANAALMAAAPDLLAALEEVYSLALMSGHRSDGTDEIMRDARVAIANATGGDK